MEEYPAVPSRDSFDRSRAVFEAIVGELGEPLSGVTTHEEVEDWLSTAGRGLLRSLFQDHLDLRVVRERRRVDVSAVGEAGPRTRVESGHDRELACVFGPVRVRRLAYRALGSVNLYPADAVLNLPADLHSHGLRRMAAVEAERGSFAAAVAAIERATGQRLGKAQVETLAAVAVTDLEAFYASRCVPAVCVCLPEVDCPGHVLVMTFDGKGVVMRPEALRDATRMAAAKAANKLSTRLSRGEKSNRKRMAEIGCLYDLVPVPRQVGDVIAEPGRERGPGPKAVGKWLTASVVEDAATVITTVFDQAERRDPGHGRTWIALVDGNRHQITRVKAEARRRKMKVTIVADFIHVLEYLWKAAWCFFAEGDPAVEAWVAGHARRILEGKAGIVAAAIRRKATANRLPAAKRKNADVAANYLLRLRPQLRYHDALEAGWPIATGIIEGACRFIVKDRMDITGARWGLDGAEAVLKLRALTANGDFNEYWRFHMRQEQQRIHLNRYQADFDLAV